MTRNDVVPPKKYLRDCGSTLLPLLFVAVLAACSGPQIRRADNGQAIQVPQPWPANDKEVRELCDFEAEQFTTRDVQNSQRSDCRMRLAREMPAWRRACQEQVLGAQSRGRAQPEQQTRIDQCVRRDKNFAQDMLAARQYREFQGIKQLEGFERFIQNHERNDVIGLVTEARARFAPACGAGVSLDATPAAAQTWRDRFSRVGPSHCVAQQAMARRVLRLDEFRQASGQRAKLEAFAAAHAGEDPDGLVPQARTQALELLRRDERAAFEQARSWAEVESFLSQYDPAREPRAVLAEAARSRRDALREEEFARVRATPLAALEQSYVKNRAQMPETWAPFVLSWLVDRSAAEADLPGGLRVFRLNGDAGPFEAAVARMSAGDDHDAEVEQTWGRQPDTADTRRAFIAYQRKRDTPDSWLRAFKLSNERADLRAAGQKAGTPVQKARVEHLLMKTIGLERAFVTGGRLSADGKAADISQPSVLFGLAKGISTTVDSMLAWQIRPSPDLPPLQHGRYRATVKLTMTIESRTRTRALGMWTSSDDKKDLTATETVLMEPSGQYTGSGNQRFRWSPTSHVSALFNLTESATETTGLKVKVEVLNVDLLEP